MLDENKQNFIVFSVLLVFVIGGLLIFHEMHIKVIEKRYESQIMKLKGELDENRLILNEEINDIKKTIDSRTKRIEENVDQETSNLDTKLTQKIGDVEKSSQGTLITLSQQISEINTENKQKMDELKEQMQTRLQGIDSPDLTAVIEKVVDSVLSINSNKGKGSGVLIDMRGYAITSYHVVNGATYITAMDRNKNIYSATLVAADERSDLAILKITGMGRLRVITIANSDSVKVGQRVIALGSPAGFDFTATQGIVSALNRLGTNGINYIQTDVPINPGSSGGPLIDNNGKMVGLNTLKAEGFEGISLAIPSNVVKSFIVKNIGS